MDIAWVAVKERRRSLQVHHSIASSEPDEASRAAQKVAGTRSPMSDIPSPEGFVMSDIEDDGGRKPGAAAPGAATTIAASGADGTSQPTLGNGQQVQKGDRLMWKGREVEVIEVTKVNNEFVAECVYLPKRAGVQALPVGITLGTPDLRHLSDKEKEALDATGGQSGRGGRGGRTGRGGKGGRGKGSKGQPGKGRGHKQQGEVKEREGNHQEQNEEGAEQKDKAKGPRVKGVGGKRAKQAVPDATAKGLGGTSAVPDAEATGAAQHTEAAPSPSKATVATQGTDKASSPPPKQRRGRKAEFISPNVSTYKSANSAGRAAYRRVLQRGGTKDEANARNVAVKQQWRLAQCHVEPAPGGEDPEPAAPAGAQDTQPAAKAQADEPLETSGTDKGEWMKARLAELKAEAEANGLSPSRGQLFGQAVSDWFAKCREDAQREKGKITTALAHKASQDCTSPVKVGTTGASPEASPEASPQTSPMSAPGDILSPSSGAKRVRVGVPGVKVSRRRWRQKSTPPPRAEGNPASASGTASSSANGTASGIDAGATEALPFEQGGATEALPSEQGETIVKTNPEAEPAKDELATHPQAKQAREEDDDVDEDLDMDIDEVLS